MFKRKHKNKLALHIILVCSLLVVTVMAAGNTARAALQIECPDGYMVNFASPPTSQQIDEKCYNHQLGSAIDDESEAEADAQQRGEDRIIVNACDKFPEGFDFPEGHECEKKYQCGKGDKATRVNFNFGCVGEEWPGNNLNPILDMALGIIRAMTSLVGVVLIIVVVIAGIRYSASQGDPNASAKALGMIRNAIIGLLFYIFIFSLVQWLVPGGIFN